VDCRQGPVVTGVHRLEHVERLATTHLADHDSVRSHAEGVPDQIADRDLALALDVGRPALKPDLVLLLEVELERVLDGHDTFRLGDEGRDDVLQGRLACTRAPGDEDVQAGFHAGAEELRHLR